MTKIKVEFEVYRRMVQDMVTSYSIKKCPSLFPKITGNKEKDKEIKEENKKEWEEFEKSLKKYREKLIHAFRKVKILKGELTLE